MSPTFLRLSALLILAGAVVARPAARACTGTISSLDDVDDAVECTTVNINSFTVPAGETFNLDLADGTTVNMRAFFSCLARAPDCFICYVPSSHPAFFPAFGCSYRNRVNVC